MKFNIKKKSKYAKYDCKIAESPGGEFRYYLEYIGDGCYNLYDPKTFELKGGNISYNLIYGMFESKDSQCNWHLKDREDDKGGRETEDN